MRLLLARSRRSCSPAARTSRPRAAPGIEVLTYPADVVVAERITKAARFVFEEMALDC